MKKTKLPYYEIFALLIGEILISLVTCAVYLLIKKFDYTVITGAFLGTAVAILNFLYLSITATRAVDEFLRLRGEKEMTEEEAAAFTAEHQAKIQNTLKISYLIRTFTMLAALIVAFLIKHFAVVATVIPLLLYKPINMVAALVKRKVVKDV